MFGLGGGDVPTDCAPFRPITETGITEIPRRIPPLARRDFPAMHSAEEHALEDRVHVNDLHATILHLFGFDRLKMTYRFQGRDFRLTDVAGKVVTKLLA